MTEDLEKNREEARMKVLPRRQFLRDVSVSYEIHAKLVKGGTIWMSLKMLRAGFNADIEEDGFRYKFKEISSTFDPKSDVCAGRTFFEFRYLEKNLGKDHQESDIYAWLNQQYHEYTRGESHGLLPEKLMENLFRTQTSNWIISASNFLEKVVEETNSTARTILRITCPDFLTRQSLASYFQSQNEARLDQIRIEIAEWLEKQCFVMKNLDCSFASRKSAARAQRLVAAIFHVGKTISSYEEDYSLDQKSFEEVLEWMRQRPKRIEMAIGYVRDVVYDMHDTLKIYCDITRTKFVDLVNHYYVELVLGEQSPLTFFKTSWVESLSDTLLQNLVGDEESPGDPIEIATSQTHSSKDTEQRPPKSSANGYTEESNMEKVPGKSPSDVSANNAGATPSPKDRHTRKSPSMTEIWSENPSPASSKTSLFTPSRHFTPLSEGAKLFKDFLKDDRSGHKNFPSKVTSTDEASRPSTGAIAVFRSVVLPVRVNLDMRSGEDGKVFED